MRHYVAEPGAYEITRSEVEALRYLNCPKKAAEYLGIPKAQVEDVWAEMPDARQRSELTFERDSSGFKTQTDAREDARQGSERLKTELLQAMLRWGQCNGTTPEETVGSLLYGRPLPAKGHIPFAGHRTVAEVCEG